MLNKDHGYRIFHFIPGTVILFFAMVSLYSASNLIDTRDSLTSNYQRSKHSFIELEAALEGLEAAYNGYSNTNHDVSEIKNKFQILNRRLDDFHAEHVTNVNDNQAEYERAAFILASHMTDFALKLVEHKKNPTVDFSKSYKKIDTDIAVLKDSVFDDFVENAFYGDIEKQEKWLYWSVFAMGFCGFFLIILNSSRVKELEKLNQDKRSTLELLENRLAALEVARDGIFIMDSSDKITYTNKAFCSIIGVNEAQRETLTGRSWGDVFSRSDCEVIEEDILPELYEDGFWVGDLQLYRLDNTVIDTDMSLTRLPDSGLIGTVQDVSYKRQAEQEKKVLEDQFYQAQKMEAIGRLAGGIAHDFNNILAAMNGYAEFLTDDLEEDSEQWKFAQNILQAGMQARELVDQMLAFSRRSDSSKNTLDIVNSVQEALSMIKVTMSNTTELQSDIAIDHAVISGNQTQISQLIMNLCVNAQDAIVGSSGTVSISLQTIKPKSIDIADMVQDNLPDSKMSPYLRIDDLEAGRTRLILGHVSQQADYVKLSVKDTGSGMSRVIMEHIFEPFFTTKPVDKGTGLGLATVHGVLIGHQGAMVIDSTLNKGTLFDLYFPLVEGELDAKPQKQKATEQGNVEDKNKHILLIEDQENVRTMVLKMLGRMGYNTSSAVSGLEGLDLIRENPEGYDLVITDHNMPKMTGLEMVHQVYEDLPDLPFILLSGHSEKKMQELIDGHPAIKAVLRKPIKKDVLAGKIEQIIDMKAA